MSDSETSLATVSHAEAVDRLRERADVLRLHAAYHEYRPIRTLLCNTANLIDCLENLPSTEFGLVRHLHLQIYWSDQTFGPGDRTLAICDHIRKELGEVQADHAAGKPTLPEWVDVILLALDGARRSGATPSEVCSAIESKFERNKQRKWPDWRTADPTKAIEHVRPEPGDQQSRPSRPSAPAALDARFAKLEQTVSEQSTLIQALNSRVDQLAGAADDSKIARILAEADGQIAALKVLQDVLGQVRGSK